jgi:exodeoxyribonuclease V beta subunit
MKAMLSKYGIPAVTIGDDKVLKTEEAKHLLYLLEAMIDNSRAAINKALLSPFTGFSAKDIINLDDEKALGLFKEYKCRWTEDGIYTALMDFIADCNVQQVLLSNNGENGERIISNLYQLIELVHKVQTTKMFSPLEVISWLKRGIEGEETIGDEYEQRVESDEEAVKIVTIHKSKGLEYKIVLAPYLDLLTINEFDVATFRDKQTGDYVVVEKKELTEAQEALRKEQHEQENRRLIYVAITRAVYKCYIYKNTSAQGKYNYNKSSLATFTNALTKPDHTLIKEAENLIEYADALPPVPNGYRYSKTKWKPVPKIEGVHFSLSNENWTQMSYSRLAAKHTLPTSSFSIDHADPYNHFVFRQLAKGERTGNMLHQIFETIHYTNNSDWAKVVSAAISKYAPRQKALYQTLLPPMIEQVLQATIPSAETSFTLAQIHSSNRIHEFEFDVPVSPFQVSALNDLSDEEIQVNVKGFGELEGVMNGKIDLFFEHNSRYYILDWKSNYLGDTLEDYSPTALATAMNDHNYHLQYLIYTLAVKKYLQTRFPHFDYERHFGGVIYMFVRGVRKGVTSGVYFMKPSVEKIEMLEEILEGVEEVTY